MCVAIAELRESYSRYAAEFDAALVTATDAATVLDHASAIEKTAATIKALAAARMAETDVWRRAGDRTAAHHLARTTGTTVGAAAEAINTARRLDRLPETTAAARRGELSPSQVSAIADAAGVDPSAEARLVDRARHSSLQELKDDCARTKASASSDADARRQRIHDRRCLRTFTDAEGAWHMHVRHNPEVGAEIMAVIDSIRDRLFAQARVQGRREPTEAYAADALTTLARNAETPHGATGAGTGTVPGEAISSTGTADQSTGMAPTVLPTTASVDGAAASAVTGPATRRSSRAKIIVRVDLPALLRGRSESGEVAELVGFGPVAVAVIRDMIDTGDPFLAAVVTKGVDVVGVAHLGRQPTAHQRTSLEWLYPTCAVEGCSAVARLEMDHREDWATTHVTLFSLIDRLCPHHHRLKTRENWGLVKGRGKRAFVAPTDDRHPGYARRAQRQPVVAAIGPPGAD